MLSILRKCLLIFSKHGVLGMRILLNVKHSWGAIRWKMLIIFAFYSVISMILVACFAVAVLYVVIRRGRWFPCLDMAKIPGVRTQKHSIYLVHCGYWYP